MSEFVLKNSIRFITCCLLAFSFVSHATDADPKQLLKTKLEGLKTFQADFKQRVVDIENVVLQQADGEIALMQPNKLYWELKEPNENILLADGDTLWNIDPFLEQTVAYSQNAQIENNPLILLTDPNSQKWQEFNVSYSEQEFTISPTKPDRAITKLSLVFDSNQLIKLETTDSQQQKSTLTFSNIAQNQPLSADKFTFTLPKGYELDDQRTP